MILGKYEEYPFSGENLRLRNPINFILGIFCCKRLDKKIKTGKTGIRAEKNSIRPNGATLEVAEQTHTSQKSFVNFLSENNRNFGSF